MVRNGLGRSGGASRKVVGHVGMHEYAGACLTAGQLSAGDACRGGENDGVVQTPSCSKRMQLHKGVRFAGA